MEEESDLLTRDAERVLEAWANIWIRRKKEEEKKEERAVSPVPPFPPICAHIAWMRKLNYTHFPPIHYLSKTHGGWGRLEKLRLSFQVEVVFIGAVESTEQKESAALPPFFPRKKIIRGLSFEKTKSKEKEVLLALRKSSCDSSPPYLFELWQGSECPPPIPSSCEAKKTPPWVIRRRRDRFLHHRPSSFLARVWLSTFVLVWLGNEPPCGDRNGKRGGGRKHTHVNNRCEWVNDFLGCASCLLAAYPVMEILHFCCMRTLLHLPKVISEWARPQQKRAAASFLSFVVAAAGRRGCSVAGDLEGVTWQRGKFLTRFFKTFGFPYFSPFSFLIKAYMRQRAGARMKK